MGRPARVGVVLPLTGRLARLADPLVFCADRLAPALDSRGVELILRDSRSEPEVAESNVYQLAADPRVSLVVTMAGTHLVPAVAAACTKARVPCLSTSLPWQVHRAHRPRGAHFCWGLGDIAEVFAGAWRAAGRQRIGCLWNDDRQGEFLRDDADDSGFLAVARRRGFVLYDAGPYREGLDDFMPQIARFRAAGVDTVTTAATTQNLGRFRAQAAAVGWHPALITCSRWLAYPSSVHPGDDPPVPDSAADVVTIVYWTPRHPYASSLSMDTPRTLARAYQRQTGRSWLQPLGLAHALLEIAAHVLADSIERAAVAATLDTASVDTIAGRIDWPTGPAPGIARIPLTAGQWRRQGGTLRLAMLPSYADQPNPGQGVDGTLSTALGP